MGKSHFLRCFTTFRLLHFHNFPYIFAPPSVFHTWAATGVVAEFVALVAPSRRTVYHTGSRDDPLGDQTADDTGLHQKPADVHIWKLWKGWGKTERPCQKKTACLPEEALGLRNGNDACQETVDCPNMWTGSAAPQISMAYRERLSTVLSWELAGWPWPERMKRLNVLVTNSGFTFCRNLQQSWR